MRSFFDIVSVGDVCFVLIIAFCFITVDSAESLNTMEGENELNSVMEISTDQSSDLRHHNFNITLDRQVLTE